MGHFSTLFQPPKAWQDFEVLTQSVLSMNHDQAAVRHGRGGQRQDGVDVYVQNPRTSQWIGVQCKQMDVLDEHNLPLPGGKITRKFLTAQATAAIAFRPELSEFVLATTSKPSISVQRAARDLSDEFCKRGLFRISVWAWDQFEAALNARFDLQQHYYQNVIEIRSAVDQDQMIIDAIGTSFRRPAFTASLLNEDANDFLQALKDTSMMLNTGNLLCRETRAVLFRTVGGFGAISDDSIRAQLRSVKTAVQQLREDFEGGLKDGRIRVDKNGYVTFSDAALGADLEAARATIVNAVSDTLHSRNLPPL